MFFDAGGRTVCRLSGTGTRGATLRVYLEQPVPPGGPLDADRDRMLVPLAEAFGRLSRLREITGREAPDAVI
jgi:phosphoglucomutase